MARQQLSYSTLKGYENVEVAYYTYLLSGNCIERRPMRASSATR